MEEIVINYTELTLKIGLERTNPAFIKLKNNFALKNSLTLQMLLYSTIDAFSCSNKRHSKHEVNELIGRSAETFY